MPGISLPLHQVLAHGECTRYEMKVGANATAAKMIPGALVVLDTTENEVKEAGAKAHGIFGVIDVDPTHDVDDAYAVGDNITIIVPNAGALVALIFLANEDFIQGDTLVSAANGLVAEIAIAALGSQGDVIGQAWCTESGAADKRVLVKWHYCPEGAAIA